MEHLEVSCAVRRFFKSLGFKGLTLMLCWLCDYDELESRFLWLVHDRHRP